MRETHIGFMCGATRLYRCLPQTFTWLLHSLLMVSKYSHSVTSFKVLGCAQYTSVGDGNLTSSMTWIYGRAPASDADQWKVVLNNVVMIDVSEARFVTVSFTPSAFLLLPRHAIAQFSAQNSSYSSCSDATWPPSRNPTMSPTKSPTPSPTRDKPKTPSSSGGGNTVRGGEGWSAADVGAAAGGVAGGVFLLLIALFVVLFMTTRRKRKKHMAGGDGKELDGRSIEVHSTHSQRHATRVAMLSANVDGNGFGQRPRYSPGPIVDIASYASPCIVYQQQEPSHYSIIPKLAAKNVAEHNSSRSPRHRGAQSESMPVERYQSIPSSPRHCGSQSQFMPVERYQGIPSTSDSSTWQTDLSVEHAVLQPAYGTLSMTVD